MHEPHNRNYITTARVAKVKYAARQPKTGTHHISKQGVCTQKGAERDQHPPPYLLIWKRGGTVVPLGPPPPHRRDFHRKAECRAAPLETTSPALGPHTFTNKCKRAATVRRVDKALVLSCQQPRWETFPLPMEAFKSLLLQLNSN